MNPFPLARFIISWNVSAGDMYELFELIATNCIPWGAKRAQFSDQSSVNMRIRYHIVASPPCPATAARL